ncbi:hypothetical protein Z517_04919 [Fonsecaea pedrosoi CBS 271.37]|uniref:Protein YTP1-like C-terminal domain-containing protein n=1 Tax=Fonsecaea pedrosoi CBS 271.37 TaxID=1442368 RepID=A0A0D2GLS8_9EURO|nr:uncharacterized protein Z517_04919 [Fonsecaea pedrosoi CBS 271.37]KIW81893.1 hypothetical protein Z517_04919 [Fonsecaea pedrosoi CBS 271.37]
MVQNLQVRVDQGNATMSHPPSAESYFREPTSSTVASLEMARSNLVYPARILLLGLHALGTVFGLAYNSKTPDLYRNSSHHALAWTLTAFAVLESIVRIMRSLSRSRSVKATFGGSHEEQPLVSSARHFQESEESLDHDHIHAIEQNYFTPRREPRRNGTNSIRTDSHNRRNFSLRPPRRAVDRRYGRLFSLIRAKRWTEMIASQRFVPLAALTSGFFAVAMTVLAFVAFCTGIVTMAGIFHGENLLNGLAHFIKGGVFFFFGIITLLRFVGSLSGLGWAWNLKGSGASSRNWHRSVTMEGLECLLIFIYGISNVFLEHLSAWGEAWTAQDLEHVAISLLFIGGGLCGMMVESRTVSWTSSFQNTSTDRVALDSNEKQTLTPGWSTNPIPAMIIFLLGTILAGHHQNSSESTMMHKWVGNFLTAASVARSLTYLFLHIAPARSRSPSRPPTELVTSFCLMCGGLMLMASNRDTVDAMMDNELNAMLVASVMMGLTAVLMAWCLAVVGIKEWAQKGKGRYTEEQGEMALE